MDIEREYPLFGELIKEYRTKAGLSQDDVATKLKLSRVSIANIESGRQRVVLHHALELARLLGFSIEALEKKLSEKQFKDELSQQPENVQKIIKGVLDGEREREK